MQMQAGLRIIELFNMRSRFSDDYLSLELNCMEEFSASGVKFMITLSEGMN
jgi:hypothetical protein